MKVFISWSGEMSHKVASTLRDWLPYVIQSLKPFLSSGDINKGARWSDVLANELKDTEFGIICITPYNINSPWLNFEAGALSKSIDRSLVFPFLFHVNPSDLRGPLSQFQSTVYEKEDVLNLLSSINSRLNSEENLEHELLRHTFDVWWPQLEEGLNRVKDSEGAETETGYKWLHNPDDLRKIEVAVDCKSIWVITPSPYQDLQNTCVREVVQKNIGRGVKYSFILPSSDTVDEARELLQHIFSSNLEQLTIREIPHQKFQNLAVTHYLILNPEAEEPYRLRVFLELPIKQGNYWIEVDSESEAAFGFVTRFRKLMNEETI